MNIISTDYLKKLKVANISIVKFPSLDSTNAFLKCNHANYPDFTVIYTDNQTSGKGRFERKWQSVSGKGLTFSIKVPLENVPVQNWCNITQLMALSVSYALENLAFVPSIRWPNDVLVNDTKLCGIIGELVQTDSTHTMILGVGLNVNECYDDFLNIDRKATSLFIESGKVFSPVDIMEQIVDNFIGVYKQLVSCGFHSFVESLSVRLFKSELPVKVISGETEYIGFIDGLTNDGKIRLKTADGFLSILSGEITSRV